MAFMFYLTVFCYFAAFCIEVHMHREAHKSSLSVPRVSLHDAATFLESVAAWEKELQSIDDISGSEELESFKQLVICFHRLHKEYLAIWTLTRWLHPMSPMLRSIWLRTAYLHCNIAYNEAKRLADCLVPPSPSSDSVLSL